jgi:glutathione S-transferase
MRSPRVRLYGRPDCHLCDEARRRLLEIRSGGVDFELEEVDIDADERLRARYLERIPVIELEGEVISELFLDEDGLRTRLGTLSP